MSEQTNGETQGTQDEANTGTTQDTQSAVEQTEGEKAQGKNFIRGTISTASTPAGIVGDVIRYLADRGHDNEAVMAAGLLTEHFDNPDLVAEAAKIVEGVFPNDTDGKALFFGPHPYLKGGPRFGLWRVELRDQMEANRLKVTQRDSKKQEKANERAEERAAKLDAKAKEAQARAEALRAKLTGGTAANTDASDSAAGDEAPALAGAATGGTDNLSDLTA